MKCESCNNHGVRRGEVRCQACADKRTMDDAIRESVKRIIREMIENGELRL